MPFPIPSGGDIETRMEADYATRLGEGAFLPRSVEKAQVKTWRGAIRPMWQYLEWQQRQQHAHTAEAEFLDRKGSGDGLPRNPAVPATGTVDITGSDGLKIPEGHTLRRSDGVEYTVDEEGTIAGGTVAVAVTCTAAGTVGDASPGVLLTLVPSIGGVDNPGTVSAGDGIEGTDEETDEQYRARYLEYRRDPPNGGAPSDYRIWAKQVPGVTRVWVNPDWDGPGTVQVFFMRDNDSGGPFPSAAEVQAVFDYITPRMPYGPTLTVTAPTEQTIDPQIQIVPNTATVQAAANANMEGMLLRDAVVAGTLPLSKLTEAISTAPGETSHTLIAPVADIVAAPGSLLTLGTPVYS